MYIKKRLNSKREKLVLSKPKNYYKTENKIFMYYEIFLKLLV